MRHEVDLADLAQSLAEIASQTHDARTARQLLALLETLLTAAGLPPAPSRPPH